MTPSANSVEPSTPNVAEATPVPNQESTPSSAPAEVEKARYTVQIFSSRNVLKSGDREFKGLKDCFYTQRGEWYKYMYGRYATEEEAREQAKKLQSKFPGCFVVPIPNEK